MDIKQKWATWTGTEADAISHVVPKRILTSTLENINFSCQIVLTICTEHVSDTAVFYANLRNDSTAGTDVMR